MEVEYNNTQSADDSQSWPLPIFNGTKPKSRLGRRRKLTPLSSDEKKQISKEEEPNKATIWLQHQDQLNTVPSGGQCDNKSTKNWFLKDTDQVTRSCHQIHIDNQKYESSQQKLLYSHTPSRPSNSNNALRDIINLPNEYRKPLMNDKKLFENKLKLESQLEDKRNPIDSLKEEDVSQSDVRVQKVTPKDVRTHTNDFPLDLNYSSTSKNGLESFCFKTPAKTFASFLSIDSPIDLLSGILSGSEDSEDFMTAVDESTNTKKNNSILKTGHKRDNDLVGGHEIEVKPSPIDLKNNQIAKWVKESGTIMEENNKSSESVKKTTEQVSVIQPLICPNDRNPEKIKNCKNSVSGFWEHHGSQENGKVEEIIKQTASLPKAAFCQSSNFENRNQNQLKVPEIVENKKTDFSNYLKPVEGIHIKKDGHNSSNLGLKNASITSGDISPCNSQQNEKKKCQSGQLNLNQYQTVNNGGEQSSTWSHSSSDTVLPQPQLNINGKTNHCSVPRMNSHPNNKKHLVSQPVMAYSTHESKQQHNIREQNVPSLQLQPQNIPFSHGNEAFKKPLDPLYIQYGNNQNSQGNFHHQNGYYNPGMQNYRNQVNTIPNRTTLLEGMNHVNPIKNTGMVQRNPVNEFMKPAPVQTPNNQYIYVNNKAYNALNILGKGGSSVVYQVLEPNYSQMMAIKCVNLRSVDEIVANGYLNEVELLSKLQGCSSVIRMLDHEYVQENKMLYVVMEKGDTDFSKLMKDITKTKEISMLMIMYYWNEMLSCVKDIHSKGIIHSDLKPANFILVSGRLKLIDFGIASSLQDDMTSDCREIQAGTYNYMSPEATKNSSENEKSYKITYKSDVWSLGCILYNMIFGRTPFSHIVNPWPKLQAIADPKTEVEIPNDGRQMPLEMRISLKWCLRKDPKLRPSVQDLLHLLLCQSNLDNNPVTKNFNAVKCKYYKEVFPNFPDLDEAAIT